MPGKRPTIVFAINSLGGGGAERALVNLLGHLKDDLASAAVHLVLLDLEEAWQVAPRWAETHVLDARRGRLASIARMTRRLRRIGPDVVVSFSNRTNCANVAASMLLGHASVISERVHTSSHFGTGPAAAFNKALVRLLYPRARRVVAVSAGIREDLVAHFGVSGDKVVVIHNPIDITALEKAGSLSSEIALPASYILGAGRLEPNKNFALLIEAYRRSGLEHPLVIIGEGSCRPALAALIARHGLEGRVMLPGHAGNPYPVMRGARFLVSPSNAEGFPNAMVEAMALGCPVVATDCDCGPLEILAGRLAPRCAGAVSERYGILVPPDDPDLLADAMRLADREEVRAGYAAAGRERAAHYDAASSVDAYRSLLAAHLGLRAG